MIHFIRSLFMTLTVTAVVLTAVLAFEYINENVSKSGFSSGEVLSFGYEEGVFSGEIMGEKFSADISPALKFLPVLENFALLLPPFAQLFLRLLFFRYA